MSASVPVNVMVPLRPTRGKDSVEIDETDGYLHPTPPIAIKPQRAGGTLQHRNEHDSGVDVDNIHPDWLPRSTSRQGSTPNIQRPTSSESAASLKSFHNPVQQAPGSVSQTSQYLAPCSVNDSRFASWSPVPSLHGVNAYPRGQTHSVQKPMNSSPAIPLRPFGDNMLKRPVSLLKSHEYEELPGSRVAPPSAEYSYSCANGSLTPQPSLPQQSSGSDSTDFLCDTMHPSDRRKNIYRRRQNPLYESHMSENSAPAKSKGLLWCQCPCLVIVFVALLATVAFIMALLVMTGITKSKVYLVSPNYAKDLEMAQERIKIMEKKYATLLAKFDEIQTNMTTEIEYYKNMSVLLEGATRQLKLLHSNSTQQHDMLSELNAKYDKSETSITKLSETTANLSSTVKGTSDLIGSLLSNSTHQQNVLTQLGIQCESLSMKFVRQNDSLSMLHLQFRDLDTQVEAMQTLPNGVIQLQTDVSKQTQKLTVIEASWQSKFKQLSDNITQQVMHVSKMQGPPGVGNLTSCRHSRYSRGGAAADDTNTNTKWIPETLQEANDWVIMGVECNTNGGIGNELQTQRMASWNTLQYRCACFGQRSGSISRYCELHVWKCPRLS